jgi:hypothetical protein
MSHIALQSKPHTDVVEKLTPETGEASLQDFNAAFASEELKIQKNYW